MASEKERGEASKASKALSVEERGCCCSNCLEVRALSVRAFE